MKSSRREKRQERGVDYNYYSPDFGKDARKSSIHGVTKKEKIEKSPGPGQYKSPKFGESSRKHTISGSHSDLIQKNDNPSPADYDIHPSRNGPSYSIKSSRYSPRKDRTPGYRNLGSTLGGPKYSIGSRSPLPITYH